MVICSIQKSFQFTLVVPLPNTTLSPAISSPQPPWHTPGVDSLARLALHAKQAYIEPRARGPVFFGKTKTEKRVFD